MLDLDASMFVLHWVIDLGFDQHHVASTTPVIQRGSDRTRFDRNGVPIRLGPF
ncbi:MAG TPA: hypothetical protein VII41_10130 [Steroidobacteraceae bacterium]